MGKKMDKIKVAKMVNSKVDMMAVMMVPLMVQTKVEK